jgi:hypothetical protein
MTLDQLRQQRSFWELLRPKQRLWVESFTQSILDGASRIEAQVFATRSAYATENPRTFSYQILQSPKIRAVLKIWRNKKGSRRKSR